MIETLGTGTFGRVMLVRLRHAHPSRPEAYFAMKVLAKTEVVRLKQVEHIISERAILSQVNHPFVVNLFCTFQDSKNCYMLMEYVIGGEIFSHLRRAGKFSPDVTRFYIATLVLAIDHLHQQKIIYRDLKPENLLLDSRGYTKITDFGFAKRVDGRTWTLCGTPEYLAPEIIESKGHSAAVDWWALGILMYEMLAGFPPFFDNHPFGTYEKILKAPLVFPSHIDAVSRDLIRQLLNRDVSKRLGNLRGGAEDVKNHFWFHGVDWSALEAGQLQAPIIPRRSKVGSTENFSKYPPPNPDSMPGLRGKEADKADLDKDPLAHLFTAF
ncbi:serine threonine kinase [Ceraceosorus bombacis]|uniref:cAMP-dependent protein kinase n=1 Tax=Ceraceosorus bombacis TaxID=401625 RepID=A0A0P1BG12_9BASI|nr:serine threonine kinase [Ceraceosorus bombacis]